MLTIQMRTAQMCTLYCITGSSSRPLTRCLSQPWRDESTGDGLVIAASLLAGTTQAGHQLLGLLIGDRAEVAGLPIGNASYAGNLDRMLAISSRRSPVAWSATSRG